MTPKQLHALVSRIVAHVANVDDDELEPGETATTAARKYLVDFAAEHGLDDDDFATLCRVHAGEEVDNLVPFVLRGQPAGGGGGPTVWGGGGGGAGGQR